MLEEDVEQECTQQSVVSALSCTDHASEAFLFVSTDLAVLIGHKQRCSTVRCARIRLSAIVCFSCEAFGNGYSSVMRFVDRSNGSFIQSRTLARAELCCSIRQNPFRPVLNLSLIHI